MPRVVAIGPHELVQFNLTSQSKLYHRCNLEAACQSALHAETQAALACLKALATNIRQDLTNYQEGSRHSSATTIS